MSDKKKSDVELGFLETGRPKVVFWNQFDALLRKSAVYQWRQYKTNCCQITFPLLLILLLFILQTIVTSFVNDTFKDTPAILHYPTVPSYLRLTNLSLADDCPPAFGPNRLVIPEEGFFYLVDQSPAKQFQNNLNFSQSYDAFKGRVFVERGNTNTWCEGVLFKEIPNVEAYPDQLALDTQIFKDYGFNEKLGGWLVRQYDSSNLDISVYYNKTLTRGLDLPTILHIATRNFIKAFSGGAEIIFNGLKLYPTQEKEAFFDLISLIGPTLYVFLFQLIFPVILGSIVYEKETELREIMKMMGLKMGTYWLITYMFSLFLYMVAFLLMWGVASALKFRYFTINDSGVLFLFFFFWGNLLVSFSFFFSVFFNKSRTATVVGYIWVFATGILSGQVIQTFFTSKSTPRALEVFFTMIPQFGLYRGLLIFSNSVAYEGPGISFGKVVEKEMGEVWAIMIVEWFFFLVLSFYLESTLKTGYGVKRHPLFFLKKNFWIKEKHEYKPELKETFEGEPEDVAAHRKTLFDPNLSYFMKVEDLRKVYPAQDGAPEKLAVKSLALGLKYGECLGFLGPNGAGKSTTISMLCGLYRPTSGTAIIDGLDLQSDIDEIHMLMGVCPQDNILWDCLTGPEHLRFYGRIKNLKGKELETSVMDALKAVNLHEETKKEIRQYSGGMKRRLSVACALMGNPKLILLDEPSTGLDPASRRQLWDLIIKQKKKCALLLTTHAMEEADALCDRIGIFAAGELKCIGSATELKKRYGKGYKLTITANVQEEDKAHKLVYQLAPQAVLLNSLNGTANFEIPKTTVKLSQFFSAMEASKDNAGIIDWGISNTTLEEVFLKTTEAEDDRKERESKGSNLKVKRGSKDYELEEIESFRDASKSISM